MSSITMQKQVLKDLTKKPYKRVPVSQLACKRSSSTEKVAQEYSDSVITLGYLVFWYQSRTYPHMRYASFKILKMWETQYVQDITKTFLNKLSNKCALFFKAI